MDKPHKRRVRKEIESFLDTLILERGNIEIAGVMFAFHEEGKRVVAVAEYAGKKAEGSSVDRFMAALDALDRL